jgi:hypothetical protein
MQPLVVATKAQRHKDGCCAANTIATQALNHRNNIH